MCCDITYPYLQVFQWKSNYNPPPFVHLPLRSSGQIGSSPPASDSVTFHTGEPKEGRDPFVPRMEPTMRLLV